MSRAEAPVRTDVGTRPRSRTERLVDATSTRLFRLPPQRGTYSVTPAIPVRMRDGAHLLTDHYAPDGPALGTVVMRGPYQRAGAVPHILVGLFAARGYHVVMQSCRGTFGSEGRFVPGEAEIRDGADTVTWLREQPWFEGRFVGVGGSYLSYTLWSMLMEPPPEMVAAVSFVSFHDFFGVVRGTGAFTLNDSLDWCDSLAIQESTTMLRQLAGRATDPPSAHGRIPRSAGRGRRGALPRGGFCVVPRLGHAHRPRRPLLAGARRLGCSRPRVGPGAVPHGMAGPLRRPDPRPVPPAARPWRGRVPHRRARGPTPTCSPRAVRRVFGETLDWVDRHLGGPTAPAAERPGVVPPHRCGRVALRGRLAAAGGRGAHPLPRAGRSCWPTPRRRPRPAPSASPTTRAIPRPRSAAGCWQRSPGTGRTPPSPAGPTSSCSPARPWSDPLDVVGVPRVTLAHRQRRPERRPLGPGQRGAAGRPVAERHRDLPWRGRVLATRVGSCSSSTRSRTGSRPARVSACSSVAGSFPRYARNLGMPGSRTEGTSMHPTHQALDLGSGASTLSLPIPT